MKYFLVEEHALEMGYGPETINWHIVVPAKQAVNAFIIAEGRRAYVTCPERTPYMSWQELVERDEWIFHYTPNELHESVPSYLWDASDGSSVWYEVRCLGELKMEFT